jgi:hypothetical protein
MLNFKFVNMSVIRLHLLEMPTPLVDIPPLRMDLASMGEPRTQRAIRPPTSLKRRRMRLWLVVHILHMLERTMLFYANEKNACNVHHDACVDRAMSAMHHDVVYASHAMISSSSTSYVHDRSRTR